MFTKAKPARQMVDADKRKAIAEYILDYVKRNPGKQIPNKKIADMTGTPPYNIGTITKQLVRMGELEHVTQYTYKVIPKLPISPKPAQLPLPPQPAPENIANQVEALAKEYVWREVVPPAPLLDFIEWLKQQ